jgi:hypothetical protein
MILVAFALIWLTFRYCRLPRPGKAVQGLVYGLLIVYAAQLLCNPIFGHAFDWRRTA